MPEWAWSIRDEKHWARGFELLLKFIKRRGHARVRKNHIEEGFVLGTWVREQHEAYRKKEMSRVHKRKLGGLSVWEWIGR